MRFLANTLKTYLLLKELDSGGGNDNLGAQNSCRRPAHMVVLMEHSEGRQAFQWGRRPDKRRKLWGSKQRPNGED